MQADDSGRYTMLKFCTVIKAYVKETFTKSSAASSFKFQRQNLMADDFLGPAFICMSLDFSTNWLFRILVLSVQIAII